MPYDPPGLSVAADKLDVPPLPSSKVLVIAALDDLMRWFAPLADEPESAHDVRGVAFALAWHWQATVPDSERKRLAMERFAEATELMAGASSEAGQVRVCAGSG